MPWPIRRMAFSFRILLLALVIITIHMYIYVTRSSSSHSLRQKILEAVPPEHQHFFVATNVPIPVPLLNSVDLALLNYNETLRNTNIGRITEDMTVIVVLITTRDSPLAHLLASLGMVQDINKVVLIVSHDYYNDALDKLVKKINFCITLQIYYPLSENRRRTQAHKNHFMWTASYVFKLITGSKVENKRVLFIEDNSIVVSDILHVLKDIYDNFDHYCPTCHFVGLGSSENIVSIKKWKKENYQGKKKLLLSNTLTNAVAFNETTWNVIRNSISDYCYHRDSSWLRSLEYVILKHAIGFKSFISIHIEDPRVISLKRMNKLDVGHLAFEIISLIKSFGGSRDIASIVNEVQYSSNKNDVINSKMTTDGHNCMIIFDIMMLNFRDEYANK